MEDVDEQGREWQFVRDENTECTDDGSNGFVQLKYGNLPHRRSVVDFVGMFKSPSPLSRTSALKSFRNIVTASSRLQHNNQDDQVSYQNKFKSFKEMIRLEKDDSKNFILLHDTDHKIRDPSNEAISKVIDWPVKNNTRIPLPNRSVYLCKLDDYTAFARSKKVGYISPGVPISSRLIQTGNRSTKVKKLNPIAPSIVPGFSINFDSDEVDVILEKFSLASAVTEFGSKLRFFFVRHMEETLCTGLFADFQIYPFGSSVNNLGSDASDLDISCEMNMDNQKPSQVFYAEKNRSNSREWHQNFVEHFGCVLDNFVPGIVNVQKIYRARIPIVKMNCTMTGLECDVSFQSGQPMEMAQILFDLCKLEPRLRELAVFVRLWYKTHSHSGPGYFTSFMLTTMIINFMQTIGGCPLLPPTSQISTWHPRENSLKTSELLEMFFHFLVSFNYSRYGMSIRTGGIISKPTYNALFVENPLDADYNITLPINQDVLKHLREAASKSLRKMERGNYSLSSLLGPYSETELTMSRPQINVSDFWNKRGENKFVR